MKELIIVLGVMLIMYFYQGFSIFRIGIFVSFIAGILLLSIEAIYNVLILGHLPNYHIFSKILGIAATTLFQVGID